MKLFRNSLSFNLIPLSVMGSLFMVNLSSLNGQTQPFVTTWNTGNTTNITIPISVNSASYSYNYDVYWVAMDDSTQNGTITGQTGATTISGLSSNKYYRIEISGQFPVILFANKGDKTKIRNIVKWGDIEWRSFEGSFFGCSNLDISATDVPDLQDVSSLSYMFANCTSLIGTEANWNWNTEKIGNMAYLFYGASKFNQNIGSWNTVNVNNMNSVFCNALAFNQNIGLWNTANVTDMGYMFSNASAFNQNIGAWDTKNVTSMKSMFYKATKFNGNIGAWVTDKVKDMSWLFNSASAFNQDISAWNTVNITDMSYMFNNAIAFNQSIGTWNTENVTEMRSMFENATKFNGSIAAWNTSNVTNMNRMFYNAINFDQNIGSWNTAKVVDMSYMFAGASKFNKNISGWNTDNVLNMGNMFVNALLFDQPISRWNTVNVTNMSQMFNGAVDFNQMISVWDVRNVADLSYMFSYATAFNQTLGSWIINNQVNMEGMLDNSGVDCKNYGNTLIGWASNPNIPNGRTLGANDLKYSSSASSARTMLTNKGWNITDSGVATFCSPLVTIWNTENSTYILIPTKGSGYDYDLYWEEIANPANNGILTSVKDSVRIIGLKANTSYRIDIDRDFPRFFFNNGAEKSKIRQITQWGGIAWNSFDSAFFGCSNLEITATDLPDMRFTTGAKFMFNNCTSLTGIGANWNWVTTNITNMNGMFANAKNFNQDIGIWNTENVTDMSAMFQNASNFNQYIGNWNTGKVLSMRNMFNNASKFNQDLNSWNTSIVTDKSGMFSGATSFNQSIDSWDVENVTDMSNMFLNAQAFNQDIGLWNTSKVVNMSNMFDGASSFNQNIGSWNTSNVTNMNAMFKNASDFNQSLAAWNVSKVNNMASMFYQCSAFNQSLDSWNITLVSDMNKMFASATSFNQNLGSWTLRTNVNLRNIFDLCGLDCANYGLTLEGWSKNMATPKNITCGAMGIKYVSTATTYRNTLTKTNKWTITDAGVCKSTGVDEIETETNALNIYPNPTTGIFTYFGSVKGVYMVMDLQGRVVKEGVTQNDKTEIDLSGIVPGIYILKVQNVAVKIIKE